MRTRHHYGSVFGQNRLRNKNARLMTGSLILFAILVVFLVKKHTLLKAERKDTEDKRRAVSKCRSGSGKNARKPAKVCNSTRTDHGAQEKLESYEVWVDSIYPEPVQRKYKKMISDEFFLILEQCGERVQNLKEEWGEMRQSRRGVPDAKEKEMQDAIEIAGR